MFDKSKNSNVFAASKVDAENLRLASLVKTVFVEEELKVEELE